MVHSVRGLVNFKGCKLKTRAACWNKLRDFIEKNSQTIVPLDTHIVILRIHANKIIQEKRKANDKRETRENT